MLFISISCKGNNNQETEQKTYWTLPDTCKVPLTSAETNSIIADIYGITPEQVTMVNVLLNWAFQNETIYTDLRRENEILVNLVESPIHIHCLKCKMKALKYCFNHRLWDDTVGKMEEADARYEILADAL